MGKPAAKKTDQIVSPGDVHIIMVPSPGGPVPTPIPHPVTSIIKDNVAESVKVMGLPGAVKGSVSQHSPPHIPGGPGPFQRPPKNKGEIITASTNVFFEGKPAAMLGDTAKMCADPVDSPVGKVIGTAATVLIGGGGQGSDADRDAAAQAAALAAAAHAQKLLEHPKTGHPVDVTNGNVIVCAEDCSLDGPVPIQFVRTYSTAASAEDGPLGYGWTHNYMESLERVGPDHADHANVHARFVELDAPSPTQVYLAYRQPLGPVSHFHDVPEGASRFEPAIGLRVARDGEEYVVITALTQHRFVPSPIRPGFFPLARIVDRHANELRLWYDEAGRPVRVTDPFRRTLHFSYDALGRLDALEVRVPGDVEPSARLWCRYRYSEDGDLKAVIDRAQGVTSYRYRDHLVVEDRCADGYSFFFSYDNRRRCVHTWGEDGYLTRWLRYDDRRGVTWEVNGEGESTFYRYDAAGRTTSIERPGGLTTTYMRDSAGRLAARRIGPVTHVAAVYDDRGRIAEFENVDGIVTSFEYDPVGRCIAIRAADGRTVRHEYDDRFNLVSEQAPGMGGLVTSEFDERGFPIRRTGPAGSVQLEYDEFGHLTTVRREPGPTLTCTYDAYGRLLWSKFDGKTTTFEWDALDRMVRQSEDGRVVREYGFDFADHLLWERDGHGFERTFRYEGLHVAEYRPWHRPAESKQQTVPFYRYRYDREGRILQVDDDAGVLLRLDYNEYGRAWHEEFVSEGWTRTREYDEAGRVCGLRDSDGRSCSLQLDASGRVTEAVYTRAASAASLSTNGDRTEQVCSFDLDEAGRLVGARTADSVVTFELNDAGQVLAVEQDGWRAEFDYDEVGRRTAIRVDGFEDALALEYAADGGRLNAIRYGSLVERREYTSDGRLMRRDVMNGAAEQFEYDEDWNLVGTQVQGPGDGRLYTRRFSYDDAGRLASAVDTIRGRRTLEYDADRLTRVQWERNAVEEFYPFDRRGNLRDVSGRGAVLTGGRMPAATFVDDSSVALEYDAKGQIVAARRADGGCWRYQYDAFGRRTRKTRFSGSGEEIARTEFLWDGDRILAERHFEKGCELRRSLFVYIGFAPVVRLDESEERPATPLVFHNDLIGAPDVCTDPDGRIVWHRTGTAFGAGFEAGTVGQTLGFPGQYWDAETGLFYNRHRHYDPATARYVQPDPIGVNGGWNLHAYTTLPLQSADPLGLGTRYEIPPRENTQHISLTDCSKLIHKTGLGDNSREEYPMHQFSGGTFEVMKGAGERNIVPLFLGDAGNDRLANTPQLVIESHGYPGLVDYYNPSTGIRAQIKGKELARQLKARGFKGDRIVLVICDAGTEYAAGRSFAQDLADEMAREPNATHVEVIAANNVVTNMPDGTLVAVHPSDDGDSSRGLFEHKGLAKFSSFAAGRRPQPAPGKDLIMYHDHAKTR